MPDGLKSFPHCSVASPAQEFATLVILKTLVSFDSLRYCKHYHPALQWSKVACVLAPARTGRCRADAVASARSQLLQRLPIEESFPAWLGSLLFLLPYCRARRRQEDMDAGPPRSQSKRNSSRSRLSSAQALMTRAEGKSPI